MSTEANPMVPTSYIICYSDSDVQRQDVTEDLYYAAACIALGGKLDTARETHPSEVEIDPFAVTRRYTSVGNSGGAVGAELPDLALQEEAQGRRAYRIVGVNPDCIDEYALAEAIEALKAL